MNPNALKRGSDMAIVAIKKVGEPVLKEKAKPVKKIAVTINKLLDDMAETMYKSSGVGLAAPQVGVSLKVVVIDVGEGIVELINPVIVDAVGTEKADEGCLSVPGIYGEVERAMMVTVEALNREGAKIRVCGKGLLARALQHEIDHLDGILFIEKAADLYGVDSQ